MQLSHTVGSISIAFDDPNLVSSTGLVPALGLAESADLHELADEQLTVPTDKGANAGLKVASLVAGMVAGADSIDDRRCCGMAGWAGCSPPPTSPRPWVRSCGRSPSDTSGSSMRVGSRFLTRLAAASPVAAGVEELAIVDVDDTVVPVHGYAKQGAGFGYNQVRGLNVLIATLSTP